MSYKYGRTKTKNVHMTNYANNYYKRKPLPAWRHLDCVLRVGKYKGSKLSEVPQGYLKHIEKDWDLTQSELKQLRTFIKK